MDPVGGAMRLGRWTALIAAGCGGDDGDDGVTGDDDDDGGAVVIDCAGLPQYDLDVDCLTLAGAFEGFAHAARDCNVDADCRALHPPCEQWDEVDCYYPVNRCFTDALLQEYTAQSVGCAEIGGVSFEGCTCFEPPQATCSSDHHCTLPED
jgi:hypothetical protein